MSSNNNFQAYLERFHLHPLDISFASKVRYLTIWNIQHGIPITITHAVQVRTGLRHLTGVPFTGPIAVQDTNKQAQQGNIHLVNLSHDALNEKRYE